MTQRLTVAPQATMRRRLLNPNFHSRPNQDKYTTSAANVSNCSGNERLVPSIGIAQEDDERETEHENRGCRDCTERAQDHQQNVENHSIFPLLSGG